MTCRWAWCQSPATDRAFFCPEHGARIAAAHTDVSDEQMEDQ